MYLSKIHIPFHLVKNPYQYHQALWLLFAGREDAERDFLYRVEHYQKDLGATLLMQSQLKPIANLNSPTLLAERTFDLKIVLGQRLRFRLRANPIKTIKDGRKGEVEKKGKIFTKTVRVPLIDENQQYEWLVRKFLGVAELESLIIQNEPALYFRKSKENRNGKIQTVLFDGILTVKDVDAFSCSIKQGIGPAKAFGCGLVSLARV